MLDRVEEDDRKRVRNREIGGQEEESDYRN